MGCKQSTLSSSDKLDDNSVSQHTLNVSRAYVDLSQHEIKEHRRLSNTAKYETEILKIRKELDLTQHDNLDLSQHDITSTDDITLTQPVEIHNVNDKNKDKEVLLSESPVGVDEMPLNDNYQGEIAKGIIAIKKIVVDRNEDLDSSRHSSFTDFSDVIVSKYFEENNQKETETVELYDNNEITRVSFYGSSSQGISGNLSLLKPNQDSYLIEHCQKTNSLILVCMDGHGSKGHLVSQFCKFYLKSNLKAHVDFGTDLKKAMSEVLCNLDIALRSDELIETIFSGTTLVLAVIRDKVVTVANIGDSKAILGYRKKLTDDPKDNTYGFIVQPLSVVHKPDSPDERARIIGTGGRVMIAVDYQGIPWGPARVYLKNEDIPGLAMSRSLGDDAVHDVGVSSKPSFETINLRDIWTDGVKVREEDDAPRFALFVATDGLFDVINNVDIIKAAFECKYNSRETVELLKAKAQNLWLKTWGLADDTTIICASI